MSDFREGDNIIITNHSEIIQGRFERYSEGDKVSVNCGNGPFFTTIDCIYHDDKRLISAAVQKAIEENQSKPVRKLRYFVDARVGCGAVRDREHERYDSSYQGLHRETPDVVEYVHAKIGEKEELYLNHVCYKMNFPEEVEENQSKPVRKVKRWINIEKSRGNVGNYILHQAEDEARDSAAVCDTGNYLKVAHEIEFDESKLEE